MQFPIREPVEKRRSIRTYEPRPLSAEVRKQLMTFAEAADNPFGVPVRIGLIETERSDQPRKLGTYGVIKGAGSFLGIVVPQEPLGLEAAGYALEKVVLYATHLGLGTCWLAGTLNREGFTRAMQTGENEWMPAITPVGYPAAKPSFHEQLMRSSMKSARRKPWGELFFRGDFHTPLTEAEGVLLSLSTSMAKAAITELSPMLSSAARSVLLMSSGVIWSSVMPVKLALKRLLRRWIIF